jgi:hypothetical protein
MKYEMRVAVDPGLHRMFAAREKGVLAVWVASYAGQHS